jgi:hypothetical protein
LKFKVLFIAPGGGGEVIKFTVMVS